MNWWVLQAGLCSNAKTGSMREFGAAAGCLQAQGGGRRQVTHVELTGRWSSSQAAQAIQLCMGGCLQLDAALRGSLRTAAAAPAG